MVKINVLKGKILESKKTYIDCATVLRISTTTFSNKMNGKTKFFVEEAAELSIFLNLSASEKPQIFLS